MFTVGRHDPVALVEERDNTDCDRLFAIVKMHEATNFFLGVEFGTFVLEAADANHLPQKEQHAEA